MALCLVLVARSHALAADSACDALSADGQPSYSVGCGGKSECQPNDLLEIKPLDVRASPVVAACLRLDDTGRTDPLPPPAATASAALVSYALAPRLHHWQAQPDLGRALTTARDARLFATAVLTDKDGRKFAAPFSIDLSSLWVAGILPLRLAEPSCNHPCGFDGVVSLTVPDLSNWKRATKTEPTKLSLMIGGIRLPAITPEVAASGAVSVLTYRLHRVDGNAENTAAWAVILKRALAGDTSFQPGLADDKGVIASTDSTLRFELPTAGQRAFASAVFAFVLLALLTAAGKSTGWRLLRDSYNIPDSVLPTRERSFSLGRCQMFWWTLIVVISWFTIGFATGNWLPLNDSALVLMGISAGVGAAAAAATPPKIAALAKALADAKTPADVAAAQSAITADPEIKSQGLRRDLLADYGEDQGLHRLQVLVFTAGLGIVYLWQSFHEGAMPVLSTTELGLMGISGSAYVGFKMAGK